MDPDKKYPKGVVLAVVELYDVLPTVDVVKEATAFGELLLGNYQPNRFAYLTRNLRMLAEPVPCKGKQAITWDLPADVEQKVRRQLQHLKDIERMKEATTTPLDVYVSLVKGGF